MRRSGLSVLLLVMVAAAMLLVWAGAQRFSSSSVRRRVRVAAAGRQAMTRARSALDEALRFLLLEANEGLYTAGLPEGSLGDRIRKLRPGEVLELDYQPAMAAAGGPGPARDVKVLLRLWFVGVSEQVGDRDTVVFSGMLASSSGQQLRGILELEVESWEQGGGIRVTRTLTSRRLFLLRLVPPQGSASRLEGAREAFVIHPVELGRSFTTRRAPVGEGRS